MIRRSVLFVCCAVMASPLFAAGEDHARSTRAEWMEGGWGVRILLPGGDREEVRAFDVHAFADQIKQLDSLSWVMLNVTQGACGSLYTAPHPELEAHIHPAMAPSRDLLGEMIAELRKQDLRILVYYASEGPAKVKKWTHFLEYTVQGSFEKWDEYCASLKMSSPEAIAEKIIKYYSLRYGENIDGWWFDHAGHGDTKLYAEAARAGNPNAAVSFNVHSQGKVVRGCKEEDVAFGHPTVLIRKPSSWEGNERMIETIEASNYVDGVLGHMFIPMQKGWWKHEANFPDEQALDWTLRVVKAGGAYTWAVALSQEEGRTSQLAGKQFAQLQQINSAYKALSSE